MSETLGQTLHSRENPNSLYTGKQCWNSLGRREPQIKITMPLNHHKICNNRRIWNHQLALLCGPIRMIMTAFQQSLLNAHAMTQQSYFCRGRVEGCLQMCMRRHTKGWPEQHCCNCDPATQRPEVKWINKLWARHIIGDFMQREKVRAKSTCNDWINFINMILMDSNTI